MSDTYWLWKRLVVSSTPRSPYRWFFMKRMVRESDVPRWVKDTFNRYSDLKLGEEKLL